MTSTDLVQQLPGAFEEAGMYSPRTAAQIAAPILESLRGVPAEFVVQGDGIDDGIGRYELLNTFLRATTDHPDKVRYRGHDVLVGLVEDDNDLVVRVGDDQIILPGPRGVFGVMSALTAVNVFDQLIDMLRERDEHTARPW